MTAGHFSRPGAIDLSALTGAAPGGPSGAGTSAASGAYVVDVTEQSFQTDVMEASLTAPVVMDFWADWCQPCRQLSPILERLADEYAGRFLLAKVDVDANQQLAAAVGAQSIPLVIAVVGGQPVPLFQGALPEVDVRRYLDELLSVAVANGVTGRFQPRSVQPGPEDTNGAEPAAEPAGDPRYAEAEAAVERGDLDAAVAAYERVLTQTPNDPEATGALAGVRLVQRTRGLDLNAVRESAAAKPDDVPAQLAAADAELLGGHVDDAFNRLIEVVARTSGDDRDSARRRLLELFTAVGDDDDRVRAARQRLALALF